MSRPDAVLIAADATSASADEMLTITKIARRYGTSENTIRRRILRPRGGFPAPDAVIGGRRYWWEQTIRAFEAASVKAAAASDRGDQAAQEREVQVPGAGGA